MIMLIMQKAIEILLSEDAIQIMVRNDLSRKRSGKQDRKVSKLPPSLITNVDALLVISLTQ